MTNEQNAPAYEAQVRTLASRHGVYYSEREKCAPGVAFYAFTDAELFAFVAALSSPPAAGDADWVMVPREPTVEMLRAAYYPDGSKALMLARVTDGLRRDYRNMIAAAPKPAAPPSVTDGPDAAWAQAYKEICAVPLSKFRETFGTGDLWKATETRANEIRALTHPGHKHAQEDAGYPDPISLASLPYVANDGSLHASPEAADRHNAARAQEDAAQEGAIPARVYYSVEHDNFYCNDTLKGMGTPFYMKWHARRREFPTLRSEGETE